MQREDYLLENCMEDEEFREFYSCIPDEKWYSFPNSEIPESPKNGVLRLLVIRDGVELINLVGKELAKAVDLMIRKAIMLYNKKKNTTLELVQVQEIMNIPVSRIFYFLFQAKDTSTGVIGIYQSAVYWNFSYEASTVMYIRLKPKSDEEEKQELTQADCCCQIESHNIMESSGLLYFPESLLVLTYSHESGEIILSLIEENEFGMQEMSNYPGPYRFVDVIDVANAHVQAFDLPSASGRYILVGSTSSSNDILKTLQELFPSLNLAKLEIEKPDDPIYQISTERAREGLGINFTSWEFSLKENIENFKEKGFFSY